MIKIKQVKSSFLETFESLASEMKRLKTDINEIEDEKARSLSSLKSEILSSSKADLQLTVENILSQPRPLPPHQSDLLNTIPSMGDQMKMLQSNLASLQGSISSHQKRMVDIEEISADFQEIIARKADLSDVELMNEQHLDTLRNCIDDQFDKVEEALKAEIKLKCNQTEVVALLSKMQADTDQSANSIKLEISLIFEKLKQMVDESRFEAGQNRLSSQLKHLESVLLEKANLKDTLSLLDAKSNEEEVNRVAETLDNKIALCVSQKQYEKQTEINETLGGEACCGRWIWESGKLKNGGMSVPWEVETVNTCSDNFCWDSSENTFVVCQTPGLYEIGFGFFSSKRPTVQVLVNGEPIISLLNPQTTRGDTKQGILVYHQPKSSANINGLTH